MAKRLADLGVLVSGVLAERRQAAVAALYAEAELIATASRVGTPVDTGELRGSTHVVPPETQGRDTVIVVAVGGPAAPYALYVHEDLEAHHDVGGPKFLETAAREAADGLTARVMARVRQETP